MKLTFEKRAPQAIRLTWGHGRYLDPWSFLHLLTGVLLGILWLWFEVSLWEALATTALLAVLYEGFEMWLEIIEDWQNSLLDVVVAVAGTWLAYFALSSATPALQTWSFIGLGLLALVLLYSGWRYHHIHHPHHPH